MLLKDKRSLNTPMHQHVLFFKKSDVQKRGMVWDNLRKVFGTTSPVFLNGVQAIGTMGGLLLGWSRLTGGKGRYAPSGERTLSGGGCLGGKGI